MSGSKWVGAPRTVTAPPQGPALLCCHLVVTCGNNSRKERAAAFPGSLQADSVLTSDWVQRPMEALGARSPPYHGQKRLHGFSSLGSGPSTPSASGYSTRFTDHRRSLITGALLRNSMPLLSSRASQVALVVKHPTPNAGDMRDIGSTPGSGSSPGGGNGNPLQYSCLKNPLDRGA